MLESAGPEAAGVVQLWWILFGIACLVVIAVVGLLWVGSVHSRPEQRQVPSDRKLGRWFVLGVSFTVLFLIVMLVATFTYSQPFSEEQEDALTIEVVGKRWWWAVRYLGDDGEPLFETANEIHIPVGTPVRLRLRSDNVIHSFWVPSLAGKMDLIPGRPNQLWLQADAPGVHRGQCAEFCGMQHAKMALLVVAESADAFESWLASQSAPAAAPASTLALQGRDVFQQSRCAVCHTIRGVSTAANEASSNAIRGPDLTHLASRRSLAAATVPNHRGYLGAWIADPQSIKPGNLMPAVPLPSDEFQALLHYLDTLE